LKGSPFKSLSSHLLEDTGKMRILTLILKADDIKLTILLLHKLLIYTSTFPDFRNHKRWKAVRDRLCWWPYAALYRGSSICCFRAMSYSC